MRSSSQGYQGYRDQNPLVRRLIGILLFLLVLFSAHLVLSRLIVRSALQGSESMQPTLAVGDRVLAVPLIYGPRLPGVGLVLPGFSQPARGDIVLVRPGFLSPSGPGRTLLDSVVQFFSLQRRDLGPTDLEHSNHVVKRVIGLPGDTVRMERFTAFVRPAGEATFVNEFTLAARPYEIGDRARPAAWQAEDPFGSSHEQVTLSEDEYFVLSDDRSGGTDSRHWGAVTAEALLARVWFRYWPFDRAGSL